MKKTATKPPAEKEKTRRVQLWEILEGEHGGKIGVYYIDLQTYEIKVQNAVALFTYNTHKTTERANPFLIRVGTRAMIKKTFYE